MKQEKCKLSAKALEESLGKYFCGYVNGKGGINFAHRYSSWDVCYKHFQDDVFGKNKFDKKLGGLHLGFYLASWGMFRGSSNLLNQGSEFFEKLAEEIKKIGNHKDCFPSEECFVSTYVKIKKAIECCKNLSNEECSWKKDHECCENTKLVYCKKMKGKKEEKKTAKGELGDGKVSATDTLVTKIMLGVYGNFPAVDSNFKSALRHYSIGILGKKKCSKEEANDVWKKISAVYKLEVEGCECEGKCSCNKKNNLKCFIGTLRENLNLSESEKSRFSDAKILDALFFTIGQDLVEAKKMPKNNNSTS